MSPPPARVPRPGRMVGSAGLVLAVALTLTACDEKLADIAGPSPNLEPKFSAIESQIFQATDSSGRTACVACHTNVGRTPAAGLNLASGAYENLVNAASRNNPGATFVIPGSPDASYLVAKLEGRAGIVGRRMPLNSTVFLTEGQILIVRRWIQQGAKKD